MGYYIKKGEPFYQIKGPFKTVTEARKVAVNERLPADVTDVFDSDQAFLDIVKWREHWVGQVAWTYDGRWHWVWVNKNNWGYNLNKDGTLGKKHGRL